MMQKNKSLSHLNQWLKFKENHSRIQRENWPGGSGPGNHTQNAQQSQSQQREKSLGHQQSGQKNKNARAGSQGEGQSKATYGAATDPFTQ
eukprot:7536194-Heterocapsa_arctica.AAC.1